MTFDKFESDIGRYYANLPLFDILFRGESDAIAPLASSPGVLMTSANIPVVPTVDTVRTSRPKKRAVNPVSSRRQNPGK